MKTFINSIHHIPRSTPVLFPAALFIFMVTLIPSEVVAQDACSEALKLATEEYDQGYFERATFRLDTCLGNQAFNEDQEREAYLLLGKIYYANLQIDQARDSVRKLLSKNPAYRIDPTDHKPGFINLYEEVITEMTEKTQPVTRRSGFWISLGGGPADGNIQCDCPRTFAIPEPWKGGAGGSGTLALGGTVSPKLQLGAEISSWELSDDLNNIESVSSISLLSFIAKYYPNATGGFHLKGGVGVGTSTLERERQVNTLRRDTFRLEASGLGMQFGLGYDIPLGSAKRFAITPFINLSVLYVEEDVQFLQEFNPATDTIDTFRFAGPENPSFFQVGISFIYL